MDIQSNKSVSKFTFIYEDPDGKKHSFTGATPEEARDAAQKAFYNDLVAKKWEGKSTGNSIYEAGNESFNEKGYRYREEDDKPEPNKQYRLIGKSDEPSIANGDSWADSKVDDGVLEAIERAHPDREIVNQDEGIFVADSKDDKADGYEQFMSEICEAADERDATQSKDCHTCGETFTGDGDHCNDCVEPEPDCEKTTQAMDDLSESMNPPVAKPDPTFKGGWGSGVDGTSNHSDKRTVDAYTVSEVAEERQEKQDRWLADLGISRPPGNVSITRAGYKRGTAVVDVGYDNLEAARDVWDNKPTVRIAADQFVDILRKEDRQDIEIPLRELTMTPSGRLNIPGHGFAPMEDYGLKSLLSSANGIDMPNPANLNDLLFPRAFSMFMALDPDIRADVWNQHVERYADKEQVVKLRTRQYDGIRSIFATVTPTYSAYDADDVAAFIADVLGESGEYRADIQYNSETTNFTMDVTMHAPSDLTDFSAGDLYEVGYRFKSNDRGGGSINGGAIAFWNECLNMIILHSETSELIRVIHKGEVAKKMEAVRQGMEQGREAMKRFAIHWGLLGATDVSGFVLDGKPVDSVHHEETGLRIYTAPQAMLAALVDGKHIGEGLARDVAIQSLLDSYSNQGGGDTMQDVMNAVTRMAHESLVDDCKRDLLEREAGALVPVLSKQATAQLSI